MKSINSKDLSSKDKNIQKIYESLVEKFEPALKKLSKNYE
jgi:hypothetical protein